MAIIANTAIDIVLITAAGLAMAALTTLLIRLEAMIGERNV